MATIARTGLHEEAPVRIDAPNAASAAALMRHAVGRFQSELVEADGRWGVLLHPDRPQEQLVLDALGLAESWLEGAGLRSVEVSCRGRRYELRSADAVARR